MTEAPAFQCGACETAHHTAKDAMACCRGAERGVSRLTNWPDAIYDATGWVVSDGLAYAIGGMVEAARRDAAGEAGRLRAERAENEKAIGVWRGRTERAEAERDRLREALLMWLDADDAGDGQECINAIAHARSVVGENRA
ncbi:MAG: hypothetical protein RLZZ187_2606 [Pseudomonadota bacterium]